MFFRYSFRPQVVSDVMSSANAGQVGMDVPVNFGDSSSNSLNVILHARTCACVSVLRNPRPGSQNCQSGVCNLDNDAFFF